MDQGQRQDVKQGWWERFVRGRQRLQQMVRRRTRILVGIVRFYGTKGVQVGESVGRWLRGGIMSARWGRVVRSGLMGVVALGLVGAVAVFWTYQGLPRGGFFAGEERTPNGEGSAGAVTLSGAPGGAALVRQHVQGYLQVALQSPDPADLRMAAGAADGALGLGLAETALRPDPQPDTVQPAPSAAPAPRQDLPMVHPENLATPVAGDIAREYGWHRHPTLGDWRFHGGIELAAEPEVAVRAALPGVVRTLLLDEEIGLTVVVTHADGWETRYGGLMESGVTVDERVDAGEVIGRAGRGDPQGITTVRFSILRHGEPVDPHPYLDR